MAGAISPTPSFHLCPDFNIPPPPNGHLQLGSVLTGVDLEGVLDPLNGHTKIPITDAELFPRDGPGAKQGFSRSLRELRGQNASIWAKIFGLEVAGVGFSFLRNRDNDETLTVEKLFVRYFNPSPRFIEQVLEGDGVRIYVEMTKKEEPIYIVTGLMWVESAKLSKLQSHSNALKGQVAPTDPHTGTTIGISAGGQGQNNLSMRFNGSSPFVLGIRVRKIWWEEDLVVQKAVHVVGATLSERRGNQTSLLDGIQYVDDELFDTASGKTVVDETELGEKDPVIWVLP